MAGGHHGVELVGGHPAKAIQRELQDARAQLVAQSV
jgi:hypothetical protein